MCLLHRPALLYVTRIVLPTLRCAVSPCPVLCLAVSPCMALLYCPALCCNALHGAARCRSIGTCRAVSYAVLPSIALRCPRTALYKRWPALCCAASPCIAALSCTALRCPVLPLHRLHCAESLSVALCCAVLCCTASCCHMSPASACAALRCENLHRPALRCNMSPALPGAALHSAALREAAAPAPAPRCTALVVRLIYHHCGLNSQYKCSHPLRRVHYSPRCSTHQ